MSNRWRKPIILCPSSPSGRQPDLTMLELPLGVGRLSVGAKRIAQPQRQQQADTEWTFFTGYRAKW